MASDACSDRLDLHDFLFFRGEEGVDLVNGLIGRLLHFHLLAFSSYSLIRVLLAGAS